MGGLSAAHELAERGYQVEIYEKRSINGGKARSVEWAGTNTGGRKPLPGEDGFRFFPGFYTHVPDTMSRIPLFGGGVVLDNLVNAKEIAILQEGERPYIFPSGIPRTVEDWYAAIVHLFTNGSLGLTKDDALFFAGRIMCLFTSSDSRRLKQYEGIDWWTFIGAPERSPQYQKICGRGLTRCLVAMRSEVASTRSVGTILIQILMDILMPSRRAADRVLNGPTNEVWINPWVDYLQDSYGVNIYQNMEAVDLAFDQANNRISSVSVKDCLRNTITQISGDHYILAVPIEILNGQLTGTPLISPQIAAVAPSLANLTRIVTDWMVGIQFYLNRELNTPVGHAIYVDSPWAVTSIAQAQFWRNQIAGTYGNGTVRDILSCDISDWDTRGNKVFFEPANQATNENQIKEEVWEEVKAHWALSPSGQLRDADLVTFRLSPQIDFSTGRAVDVEPLLINVANTRQYRPKPATEISNLFLAADYVITNTDLATMEAANEAGRRAANHILKTDAYPGPFAKIWELEEPMVFKPLKDLDEMIFAANPDAPPPWCEELTKLRMPERPRFLRWRD